MLGRSLAHGKAIDPSTDRRVPAGVARNDSAARVVLPGQRGLPLPGSRVRGAAVRAGRRAGGGLAPDRVRGRDLWPVATTVAPVRGAGSWGPAARHRLGRGARGDELLVLPRDRPVG